LETSGHGGGAVGPVPDEQAEPFACLLVQLQAGHGAGNPAARTLAAGFGLHVTRYSPVPFALQDDFVGCRQPLPYAGKGTHLVRPVLAGLSVAAGARLL